MTGQLADNPHVELAHPVVYFYAIFVGKERKKVKQELFSYYFLGLLLSVEQVLSGCIHFMTTFFFNFYYKARYALTFIAMSKEKIC